MADYNRDDRSTGALFKSKTMKSEKSPAMRGELTLTKDLLRQLVDSVKAGKPAKLSISAWNNTSKAGNQYISLAASQWVERGEEADAPF